MTLLSSFTTHSMQHVSVGIYNYPFSLKSSVYGFEELLLLANRASSEQSINMEFVPVIFNDVAEVDKNLNVLLLPPATNHRFYLAPDTKALSWIQDQHKRGCVVASACAGAFILAACGLVKQRTITTHWGLEERFRTHFPSQPLDINKILINHGDILCAGGMMSWLDLGLDLVNRYASADVMRQVGKMLVVDTAPREQRFYQQFNPSFLHGDLVITELQQWINLHFHQPVQLKILADRGNVTERTLQRRFRKATGLNPIQYLQRVRVQKACDLLESTSHSFEWISGQVGYEDTTACRKVFVKIMGLTPVEFRRRFRC